MKEQVIFALKYVKNFAIQLNETTDFSSNSQIKVQIILKRNCCFVPLKLRSRGIDIYCEVHDYFNGKSLIWKNIISVSLDEPPAMPINGLSAFTKKNNPNIDIIYCMILCQALMVKYLELTPETVMNDVVKIESIIKGYALVTWLF